MRPNVEDSEEDPYEDEFPDDEGAQRAARNGVKFDEGPACQACHWVAATIATHAAAH